MFKTTIIICYCLFLVFFSGCIYKDEAVPELVTGNTPAPIVVRPPVINPPAPRPPQNIRGSWLPATRPEKRWTAIVIHHSATAKGNAAIFDKWHKEGRHWDGVGYHFVIGNGTDSGDGLVEPTYRWTEQKTGAHCGGTPNNWANAKGIGICLVGDFNQTQPTIRQMNSTLKLVRFLQNRYRIPKSRIFGHKTTPGAHKTECPGKNFPMAGLKRRLDF